MSKEYVTNDDLAVMEKALNESALERNALTLEEFEPFSILYNTKWEEHLSENEIHAVGATWRDKIDIYGSVKVTDNLGTVLFILPPMFSRAPALNEGTDRSSELTQRFDKALASNHLLRDDKERALYLMKGVMDHVQIQRSEVLNVEFEKFNEIVNNLQTYFAGFQSEEEPLEVLPDSEEPDDEDAVGGDKLDTSNFSW